MFIGYANAFSSSAVEKLVKAAEVPSLNSQENTALDLFPEKKPEARRSRSQKKLAVMKETSLNTSNADAIATNSANVSEIICIQVSMQIKISSLELSISTAKKDMNEMPILPHTKKLEVPEELKDFLTYNSGEEDAVINDRKKSTPMTCRWHI